MRSAHPIQLTPKQRRLLRRWRRDSARRRSRRAAILLLAARGWTDARISQTLKIDAHCVARWRRRFLVAGLEGVLREHPRSGRPRSATRRHEERILALTRNERPPSGTHWSTRALAARLGVGHMLVARVWKRAGVTPPHWPVPMVGDE